jgi:thiol-disulfide isomerase/thioredoxin
MKVIRKAIALLLLVVAVPLYVIASPEHVPAPAAQDALDHAMALDKDKKPAEALTAFIQAIEVDPEFLAAHERLEKFMFDWHVAAVRHKDLKPQVEAMKKTIDAKYAEWDRRFPNSFGIPYGMGTLLQGEEDPKARTYLLEAARRDPNNAKVYSLLRVNAEFRGNKQAAAEYSLKASMLEPTNATYAYDYLRYLEPSKQEAATLDIAKRFPNDEATGWALIGLAMDAPNDTQRIAYYEQLRAQFPPEKFGISLFGGTPRLFAAYLRVDPQKAVKLAQDMPQEMKGVKTVVFHNHPLPTDGESKGWDARLTLAQAYIEINRKLTAGKPREALGLLDQLNTKDPFEGENAAMLAGLKNRVLAETGQGQEAYQALLQRQAKWPQEETQTQLQSLGAQMHKTAAQIHADVKAVLESAAKPAPVFDLQRYTSNDTVSLAKLRGKVVFVTFWFPGCGPCRAEMPHLEAVLERLHNKDIVYLGINGQRDQDAFVPSFMEKTRFSFIALKGTEAVTGSKGYKVKGYPSNFLIDRTGRIVYSNFAVHDAADEQTLQRMLELLLS